MMHRHTGMGDFYYTVVDRDGVPSSGGVAKSAGGVAINNLEQYNASVLGPMQVPPGGRVITFKDAAEQQAWTDALRKVKSGGNLSAITTFLSTPPSSSVSRLSTTTKIAIGVAVIGVGYLLLRRK